MMRDLIPTPIDAASTIDVDLLVLAAGFEDRANALVTRANFKPDTHVVLVVFDNGIESNSRTNADYERVVAQRFSANLVHKVVLSQNEVVRFKANIRSIFGSLPDSVARIGIDVSGMPAYAIFAVLNEARAARPYHDQLILYTSASEYTPSREEYHQLVAKQGAEIEYIPKSMALEMDRNLIYDPFAGYRSGDRSSCLALFAGYELHRSTGVIDAVNPTVLLLVYGQPAGENLEWRLDLSRRLHHKFETTRRCATEKCSTQSIVENVELLERYYDYIIDDYDLTIAPICSKMQTIATYIFWEKYPEVQVTFPLPIGYDPARRPRGIASTYAVKLPGRLAFGGGAA
ncbi:hypothetical protein [Rhizobium leguminosarum]|uniref:hypothetical protein n=1 Tax=Rhizobium leguminosarum TaxID=384 RepID=UPI001C91713C|nr:hypothetical protein [Rhizobium leguminosarum]MBY2937190.1 hypothetical protein [Rhizobium leguminosarum]